METLPLTIYDPFGFAQDRLTIDYFKTSLRSLWLNNERRVMDIYLYFARLYVS